MYNKTTLFKQYLISTITFLIIDFAWLGLAAKKFYDQAFAVFDRTIRWPAALGAYVLLILGINMFVLPRVTNLTEAIVYGGLFGLVVYGVYDLTNYATLADWALKTAIVDMVWGFGVCAAVTVVTFLLVGQA